MNNRLKFRAWQDGIMVPWDSPKEGYGVYWRYGEMIADLVAYIGSIDIVLGEVDR